MSAQSPVPKDHPMMIAWESYKATDEYANSKHWAQYKEHVDGSLWASFITGWESQAKRIAELEAALSDATEAQQVLGLKLTHAEAEVAALRVDAAKQFQAGHAAGLEVAAVTLEAAEEKWNVPVIGSVDEREREYMMGIERGFSKCAAAIRAMKGEVK